ncbi:MAG: prepilin-type N-terminal cleavage/methylation domain-containing protein [Bacillota bacterium]
MRRFNHTDTEKGFSLVEVLMAMAILCIVVVAFTQLMGWSFTNIFAQGEKSRAIAATAEKVDRLSYVIAGSDTPEVEMAADPERVAQYADLLDKNIPLERRFYFEAAEKLLDGINVAGYNVTVAVYYQDYRFHVLFEQFISKEN